MRVRLPHADKWTPDFQRQLNGELERALERLNEYALVPYGGAHGDVLTRDTERPFVMKWAPGGGGGALVYATCAEADAGVITDKVINPAVGACSYDRKRVAGQHEAGKGTQAVTLAPSGTTVTVDCALSNVFQLTLSGNYTLADPVNPLNGQTVNILLRQDITGGRTLAFSGAWTFANRVDPVLTATAGAVDMLSCQWDAAAGAMRCTFIPDYGSGFTPPAAGADLTFSNVGGANGVVVGVVGSDVRFRSLAGGGDIGVDTDGDVIRISYSAPSSVSQLSDLSDVSVPGPQNGDVLVYDGTLEKWIAGPPRKFTIGATFTNGANVLATPVNRVNAIVSEKSTILGWYMLTDGNFGACTVGVYRDSFADYAPYALSSITGGNDPAVDSNYFASDFALAGWSPECNEGDVITFELIGSSNFKSVQLVLVLQRTY